MANKEHKSVHWLTPTTIASALAAGVLFAAGHHIFYQGLDGSRVTDSRYEILGSDISDQQMIIAVGTAFAFLVKACLVAALSTAYIQLLWRAMLYSSQAATLDSLDTIFAGLTQIWSLLKVWIWWRYPLLFCFVILAWLIPIASIITPATLSIKTELISPTPSSMEQVPSLGFSSLNFVADMYISDDQIMPQGGSWANWRGPSAEVEGIVNAVLPAGPILPITPPGKPPSLNATWTTEFDGPMLQCRNVSDAHRRTIENNIVSAMSQGTEHCTAYGFLAWTSEVPFFKPRNDSFALGPASFLDQDDIQGTPAVLYLAAMPAMLALYGGYEYGLDACVADATSMFAGSTMLACELRNSRYRSAFHYRDGEQVVLTSSTPIDEGPLQLIESVTVIAAGYGSPDTFTTDFMSSPQDVLTTLSYQSIMQAFNAMIIGSAYAEATHLAAVFNTSIVSTVLLHTLELQFLSRPPPSLGSGDIGSIKKWVNLNSDESLHGLVNSAHSAPPRPLGETVEELFQNVTISMMSSNVLQPNTSSVYYDQNLVNVTRPTTQNVYTYSATKLWLAYGVAILFSTFASIIGLIALAVSGASYSNNFSSIFRVARGTHITLELDDKDLDGKDPLPPYLSELPVRLRNSAKVEDGNDSTSISSLQEGLLKAIPDGDPIQRRNTR